MSRRKFITGLAALTITGCAASVADQSASFQTVRMLQSTHYPAMAVGSFALSPELPKSADSRIMIRGVKLSAPAGGFTGYMQTTFATELAGAGKLSDTADIVLSGEIESLQINTMTETAIGALGVRILVSKKDVLLFDKSLEVNDSWTSHFIGAVAIPTAQDHFTALFTTLARKLFADPEFVAKLEMADALD